MASPSLRDELLALPGVAEVEVEGDGASPQGVRIRLAAEADADLVGAEVQRLLAAHGMRSRMDAGPAEAAAPAPLVAGPLAVVPAAEAAAPGPVATLASVGVEETASAVKVTVAAADGRQVTRNAGWSEDEMAVAVVEAVGLLLEGTAPRVLAIDWTVADGSRVVTVVLESSAGRRGAGAGLVRVSRGYAVARAAWAALTS